MRAVSNRKNPLPNSDMEAPMQLMSSIEKENAKNTNMDHFDIGDMVEVHVWIKEGEKRRVQVFSGLITRINHGRGVRGTFTVRRIVSGLGVERIFPFHSPNIEKVEITRYGRTRRAKLYYLRDRIGKEALKVKELMGGRRKRHEEEKGTKEKRVKKRGKKAKAERRKRQEAEGPASKKKGKKKKGKSKKG
jgi:large subunit ribosomal protein L19